MMNALEQLIDKINPWVERLLLKGLAKINEQDIEEVKQYMIDAQQMDMKFLVQLLEKLETEGRNYIRNSRADIADLTQSYFYLCQYVELLGRQSAGYK